MLEKIKEVILEYVEVDPNTITENTNIRSDLQINSYEVISMIAALEDEFNVSIPDRAIIEFQTIKDIIDFIEEAQS